MKSIKAWIGTMEMEWNWNKQTIVFGKLCDCEDYCNMSNEFARKNE